ncbi:MAG: hypothetical protein U1E27_06405, partial [Kiritimatiellia bacterium]|nr:hypothetical protein [Kiritimatiellia bacterium]
QLPFPVAECRFVGVETRPTGTGQIAGCAVVARREALGDFLRGLAEQRLDPIRLDCEGLALWSQSLMECPVRDPNQPVVVACISSHRSVLAVGLGTRFQTAWSTQGDLFARDGDWEARQGRILRALRSALGTPERPVNWRWTGSRADDLPSRTTAQTWLESALGATEWTLHRDPDLFLARALARRALQPDRWACSFRTGDLASPIEKNQRRRQTFRAALGCAIVGVLLLAANGILGWQIRRIETRSRDLLNRTACQISGAAFIPRGVEERTVREAVERQETQREPMERVFRPPLIASLRAISIAAREDSMQIEQMDLADSRIEIFATTAKSMETDHLRAALESLGYSSTWNPAPEAGRPGRIRVIAEKVR